MYAQDTAALHYAEIIKASDIKEYITVLASDSMEGRETAQPGQKKAARYIAHHFDLFGIPKYKGSYFQSFSLYTVKPSKMEVLVNGKKLTFLKDFYHLSNFGNDTLRDNKVTVVGKNYGDVKGKILVVFLKYRSESEIKTMMLSGAKAILVIDEKAQSKMFSGAYHFDAERLKVPDEKIKHNAPVLYISMKTAKKLLRRKLNNTSDVETAFEVAADVLIQIGIEAEKVSSENVIGFVSGSDLKDQVVVITAHYDHLGIHDGSIFHGADDDGSGTAGVMALAHAFAKAKEEGHGPRRSMLFMTVSGEEKGLLGSSYYAANPLFRLDSTVADLNIDMIGRIDPKHGDSANYVYLIGSDKLSSELHKISDSANAMYTKLDLDYTFNAPKDPNRFYYRSDHYNFAKHGIPVIFYFNGTHEDYHQPTDTSDKINFAKVEKISRLVFFTAWELVNRDKRVVVDRVNDFKATR
jgi:Zn-dependent M28 family amino/carboxypeptidase